MEYIKQRDGRGKVTAFGRVTGVEANLKVDVQKIEENRCCGLKHDIQIGMGDKRPEKSDSVC